MAADLINASLNSTIINTTINESVNQTTLHGWAYVKGVFVPELLQRTLDLVSAPAKNPEMVWIVAPLIVGLFVMTFYFGRYATEELGWNTAVGNTLVLIFVSIDLLRHVYNNPQVESTIEASGFFIPIKTAVALLVLFEGFTLLYANFLHWLPKKIAFFITSGLPVNLTAYVAITIVYSNIPFDLMTLFSAITLFILLLVFFKLIKFTEWELWGATDESKKEET